MRAFKIFSLIFSSFLFVSLAHADPTPDEINELIDHIYSVGGTIKAFGALDLTTLKKDAEKQSIALSVLVRRRQREIFLKLSSIHDTIMNVSEKLNSAKYLQFSR